MNGPKRVWVVLNAKGLAFAMAMSEPPRHVLTNGETAIPYVPAAAAADTSLTDTIENRALDLLCGECDLDRDDYDEGERINAGEALRAVVAALTPPDGWVLMPVEATAEMLDDAYAAFPGFAGEDQIDAVYAALIAARPEVA